MRARMKRWRDGIRRMLWGVQGMPMTSGKGPLFFRGPFFCFGGKVFMLVCKGHVICFPYPPKHPANLISRPIKYFFKIFS